MQVINTVLSISLLFISSSAFAVTIYECIDEDGRKSFQDRCPPGTEVANQRTVGPKKTKPEFEVTLYTVTNCRACDSAATYLKERDIEFEVKNVSGSVERQDELKKLTGSLKIPTVVINNEISTGYNEDELAKILKKVGWRKRAKIDG